MKQKILHLAATLAAFLTLRPRGVVLADIAEGQHLVSQGITLEADIAIPDLNLLMNAASIMACMKGKVRVAKEITFRY